MTGGILQLVARGYDDTYIIKEPEITYFKIVYRRHTNFAIFPKILKFQENLNFGKIGKCRIKMLGDLLSKVYLAIEIPEINITDQHYTINDIINILKEYEILLNYIGNTEDYLQKYFFDDIKIAINEKINELENQYKNEKIIQNKKAILAKLKKIAFKNKNCWYFPSKEQFFNENFKHNELSQKLVALLQTGKPQFAWVRELAHYLVDYVEVNIGGMTIDTHNSEIIRSDHIINLDENKVDVYNKMIGNIYELYGYNSDIKPKTTLYLPLTFWFCRHFSEAIPLVAMPHSFVDINVKFRNFDEVSYSTNVKFIKPPKLNAYLIAHYIYVEKEERKRLCENKLEYLIETFESSGEEIYGQNKIVESKEITNDNPNNLIKEFFIDYKLNFNYTSKQIFWIVKPYHINNPFNKFDYTFYDEENKPYQPLTNLKIKFNGRDREILQDFGVYSYWQSYKHWCSSLVDNMYLYNFALYPQQLQPSGTGNFGKLAEANMHLYLNNKLTNMIENNNYKFKVSCYSLNYNILRFFSGMAGLAFTT